MYSDQFEKLCKELESIIAHWQVNARMRGILSRVENSLELSPLEHDLYDLKQSSPLAMEWRVMDHCSAIARLYAVYEHYCESILHDWLHFLTSRKTFDELPDKIVRDYPKGFSYIIGLLPSSRYDQLSVEDMVAGYNAALACNPQYNLVGECLTRHRMNLRWEELSEIYQRFGISNVADWISKDAEVIDFFATAGQRTTEQISAKLAELVQYRNDASHGAVSVDEILGQQQFLEFAHFIRIICSSLNNLHHSYALELLLEIGEAKKVGTVAERFRDNIVICKMDSGTVFKGQKVSFLADRYCVERRIMSMQVNGVEVQAMSFIGEMELGIKLDQPITRKKAALLTNSAW
ncbi:MAE_28990/MAE_18760 family HEPN-like nuclease [uncultured Sulfitobacter sp.]|uniref:MAE_28990/MAE_18760 family HEPN-like nuclease n=1 Tax=uncultured Sulfitobacter sp. TaxID=191468 RepID=UPI002619EC80|nr:MAE_28990/MAE_18760 family HEPN-like nuclease [uncultured Sulfitobacter sp.]